MHSIFIFEHTPPRLYTLHLTLYTKKITLLLHISKICCTFEHLPWLYNPNKTIHIKPFCSPVRLSPAIGVMSGAHYQSSIQELLHLVATFASCSPYSRYAWRICAFFGTPLPLRGGFPPKKVEVVAK